MSLRNLFYSTSCRIVYNPDGMLGERFFGRSTARTDSISAGAIKYKQEASKLSPGEVSRIFEANSAFHIIKCVEREQYGHEPFENVRQNVRGISLHSYVQNVHHFLRVF